MDLLSLVTSGVNSNEVDNHNEDILGVVEGWQDDETHNPDVPAVSHKRGMTPFVFVPFEQVYVHTFLGFPQQQTLSNVINKYWTPGSFDSSFKYH